MGVILANLVSDEIALFCFQLSLSPVRTVQYSALHSTVQAWYSICTCDILNWVFGPFFPKWLLLKINIIAVFLLLLVPPKLHAFCCMQKCSLQGAPDQLRIAHF